MLVFRVQMSLTNCSYHSSIGLFVSDKYHTRELQKKITQEKSSSQVIIIIIIFQARNKLLFSNILISSC